MNGLINVKFVIRLSLPQPSGDGHGLHRLFDDIDLLMFGNVVMDAANDKIFFGFSSQKSVRIFGNLASFA
jgi:hypothetical protein